MSPLLFIIVTPQGPRKSGCKYHVSTATLCDHEQVASPLCALLSSPIKRVTVARPECGSHRPLSIRLHDTELDWSMSWVFVFCAVRSQGQSWSGWDSPPGPGGRNKTTHAGQPGPENGRLWASGSHPSHPLPALPGLVVPGARPAWGPGPFLAATLVQETCGAWALPLPVPPHPMVNPRQSMLGLASQGCGIH